MTNIEYKIKWYFKHKRSKKRTYKILKKIEGHKGKTNPKLIKLCNEYAQDILGDKRHAYWLHVYTALQGRFIEGWIPDDYYKKEVVPILNGDYGEIADRNFVLPYIFNDVESLDLAYTINGRFCSKENKIIPPKDLSLYLFNDNEKIVHKVENSKQGKGVSILNKNTFDTTLFASNHHENGVFKKFIKQHSFFNAFSKNSVATIRVTTTSDENGKISARAAYIRFGRENDSHVISKSAVSVPVDIETGQLFAKGYINWQETYKHPDSNIFLKRKQSLILRVV